MSKSAVKNVIIAISLLITTSIFFGVLVLQVWSKEVQLSEQVALLATHRAQQDTFYDLQRTTIETEAERDKLAALYFERSSESVDFLNQVEGLGPTLGIDVETDTLTEISDEDGTNWVEMTFLASGPLAGVETFMALLENSPYALRTTSFELEERSSTIASLRITVQIKLLAYES